jgi:hypothetical protein
MWDNVTKVVAEVQGGEHEIRQGVGFSPLKPNIELDALNKGWAWLKLTEVMQG